MKIYVITKGCYSDYHICAVATDPEQAEKLAKIFSDRYDEADVEEFDTEAAVDLTRGRIPWELTFTTTGNMRYGPRNMAENTDAFEPGIRVSPATPWSPERLIVSVYAPNEEAAVKIAAEKRAEFLTQRAGL